MTQGFLVLDKPAGITSRAAVNHAQVWFPGQKLGHAGTLDPAATGVLILAVGSQAARLLEYVQDQPKEYITTIRLGATSTTDDADGEITPQAYSSPPTTDELNTHLQAFRGTLEQVPPSFSAARLDGERAHHKARRGEKVVLAPRLVTVHELVLQNYTFPEVTLRVHCSKGTYIRSLARDLGRALNCGGYVLSLRRIRIGHVSWELALSWNAITEEARQHLYPLHLAVAHLPKVHSHREDARRLLCGQLLPAADLPQGTVSLWWEKHFLGVGEVD
ncbi:MAG TPA: tRNA pseudouridine(55) synthase TruB, partial [Gemmatales bacterium]|nr:tRNA pseudouridine(55) synthase TruB [Gemmatales bacterium]